MPTDVVCIVLEELLAHAIEHLVQFEFVSHPQGTTVQMMFERG